MKFDEIGKLRDLWQNLTKFALFAKSKKGIFRGKIW